MRRWLAGGAIGIAAVLVLIQLVPYGRDHDNPPVVASPAWDSLPTEELVRTACYDCHSNETLWPWYSNIAPISWLNQNEVDEGRRKLNFSEWGRGQEIDDLGESVMNGGMPPAIYTIMHPSARLDDAEIDQLLSGFEATFGVAFEGGEGRGGDDGGSGGGDQGSGGD